MKLFICLLFLPLPDNTHCNWGRLRRHQSRSNTGPLLHLGIRIGQGACTPWASEVHFCSQYTLRAESSSATKDYGTVKQKFITLLGGGLLRYKQTSPKENQFWDFKINVIGKKDETPIHFCEKCELPIRIYGRMIPCKHVFCYGCAILNGIESS